MKPSIAFERHRDAIREIVARHRAVNARVFGSVLRGDDREDSDLDILIDPTPDTTLFDIGAIRHELPLSFVYQMRNAVAHGYFKVDLEIVWKTIEDDLPRLEVLVDEVIVSLNRSPST
jgi:predicted nucleotidyltransferase